MAALVAGAPEPAGFDSARLAATRDALLGKRAGQVAAAWPLLAAGLGPRWTNVFREYTAGRPPVGPLRDGWDLARLLAGRGELAGPAAGELRERERTWRYDGAGPPRLRRARPPRLITDRLPWAVRRR